MIKNPARKAGKRLPARGLQQSGGQPVAVLAWAELAWGLRGRRILSVTLFDSPAQRRRCQWYSATITQLCIADLRCRHHRPFALVGGDDGPQAERISFFFLREYISWLFVRQIIDSTVAITHIETHIDIHIYRYIYIYPTPTSTSTSKSAGHATSSRARLEPSVSAACLMALHHPPGWKVG